MTDEAIVDGDLIQQYLVPYPSTDDSWPAARVKLVTVDGYSKILPIYLGDGDWEDGDWGVELFDTGNGWGTGYVQSKTGYNTIDRVVDILHGDVLDVPPEVMEALFIVELGYNEWNDGVGDYVWKTLAESTPETYKDLVGKYMYAQADVAPSSMTPWTPMTFHTIPEPSSGLLLLFGLAPLLLARKSI